MMQCHMGSLLFLTNITFSHVPFFTSEIFPSHLLLLLSLPSPYSVTECNVQRKNVAVEVNVAQGAPTP